MPYTSDGVRAFNVTTGASRVMAVRSAASADWWDRGSVAITTVAAGSPTTSTSRSRSAGWSRCASSMTTAASDGSPSRGGRAITVTPAARSAVRISLSVKVFPVPTPPDTRILAGSVGDDTRVATASLTVTG